MGEMPVKVRELRLFTLAEDLALFLLLLFKHKKSIEYRDVLTQNQCVVPNVMEKHQKRYSSRTIGSTETPQVRQHN